MIGILIKKELLVIFRNRSFLLTALIIQLLLFTAAAGGYRVFQESKAERLAAEKEKREQWLHQDPKHPHIAAHFGNFAYMPKTGLSLFDYGLDAFTGTVVYLEPHKQNEFSFKPAEEQNASLRFGELSLAMILQLLFPLLIIFNCFTAFSKERSGGTIQLLYSQGVSFRQLYLGKFLACCIWILLLVLPAFILLLLTQIWIKSAALELLRLLLLSTFYLFYLFLVAAVTLLVSAYSKNAKPAILTMIGIWLGFMVLVPKWSASAGDNLYPLPSKYDFLQAIRRDIHQGIDGHNAKGTRAEQLKTQLLQKYHVDTVSKLPFNFEGYVMQAGEAYSSRVYDKHFSKLQSRLQQQNQIGLWCSLIDPFMAIKNISMGLCGTDYGTHLDFQRQAENYRRFFVRSMNQDMEEHSKLGDWEYKVKKDTYAKIPAFHYVQRTIGQSLAPYLLGFCSLGLWLLVMVLLVEIYNKQSK